MPFARPTLTNLQQQAVADLVDALPELGGQILQKSVLRAVSASQAALAWSHYGFVDWVSRQSVPWTATDEYLAAWSSLKGVLRKAASPASGTASATGTAGAVVPAGTIVQTAGSTQYTTEADITVGGAAGAITAVLAGASGNADAGLVLTPVHSVAGITSLTASALTGGADVETDDSLRTRMLTVYAAPPMGGAASDYVEWAMQVPGVTRAWCLPNGMGLGTVVVYSMFDTAESAHAGFPQGANGAASEESRETTKATNDLALVAEYLFPRRPVSALVYSIAPVAQPINITLSNVTPNTSLIRAAISDALTGRFVRIGSPLGMTVYESDIDLALASVSGLRDWVLVSPSTTAIALGALPTLGTLTFA